MVGLSVGVNGVDGKVVDGRTTLTWRMDSLACSFLKLSTLLPEIEFQPYQTKPISRGISRDLQNGFCLALCLCLE